MFMFRSATQETTILEISENKYPVRSVESKEMETQWQKNKAKKRPTFPSEKECPVARADNKKGDKQILENSGLIPQYVNKKDSVDVPKYLQNQREEDVATKTKKPKVVRKKHVPAIVNSRKGHMQILENSGLIPQYIYKKDFGELPLYLQQRKQEQKAHEEFLNKKSQQETIQQVSDEERKTILELLKKKLDELNSEYLTLPLVISTFSKQRYKDELEAHMTRLEKYICLLESTKIIYYDDSKPEQSEIEDVSQLPQIKKKLQTQNLEDASLVNHPKLRCVVPLSNIRIKQSEGQESLRNVTPLLNKRRRTPKPESVELGKYQTIRGNLMPLPPISSNKHQSTKWRLTPDIQQNESVLGNLTPLPPISTNKSERKVLPSVTGIRKTGVTLKVVELAHLPVIPENRQVYIPTPPPKNCPSIWEAQLKQFKKPNSFIPPVTK